MSSLVRKISTVELSLRALRDGVEGDFVETGVWDGGSSILMALTLEKYDKEDRQLWSADSFQGLPTEDEAGWSKDQDSVRKSGSGAAEIEGRVRANCTAKENG